MSHPCLTLSNLHTQDFCHGVGWITYCQLNHLELALCQYTLLKRGCTCKREEEEELAAHLFMEYSVAVGIIVINKLASTTERTEEGVRRLTSELKERINLLEEQC